MSSCSMTFEVRQRKPSLLVFATEIGSLRGASGAALGTRIFMAHLRGVVDADFVRMAGDGLESLAGDGALGKISRIARTVRALLGSFFELTRKARETRFDYVYYLPSSTVFGSLRDLLFCAVKVACLRDSRLIIHIHNGNYFTNKRLLCRIGRMATLRVSWRVIVLSKRLVDFEIVNEPEKLVVIPNTIDMELAGSGVVVNGRGPCRLLYFSNFILSKGYNVILDALEILGEAWAGNLEVSFYGAWSSEPSRQEFLSRVEELRALGFAIHVGGYVSNRVDAQGIFSDHDVFCLPTSYAAEAQPRSVLEAMANGCAIIATEFRAIPDMVDHGRNGFLIEKPDGKLLAEAVRSYFRGERDAFRRASIAKFEREFSLAAIEAQVRQLFI